MHLSGAEHDPLQGYRMDEVQALYYLADAWLKVQPSTIANCWRHTNILGFKTGNSIASNEDLIQSEALPLESYVVEPLRELIPHLPGNTAENGASIVRSLDQLDLEADESSLLTTPPLIEIDSEDTGDEENLEEEEEEEEEVDILKSRNELKRAYQMILCHTIEVEDDDRAVVSIARRKLDEIRYEELLEKKQTDVRQFFQPARRN